MDSPTAVKNEGEHIYSQVLLYQGIMCFCIIIMNPAKTAAVK